MSGAVWEISSQIHAPARSGIGFWQMFGVALGFIWRTTIPSGEDDDLVRYG